MASEYGWSKTEILEHVYLDEMPVLTKTINKRKLSEMRVALSISQNPHTQDPRMLWKELDSKELELDGRSYLEEKFDEAGFANFRAAVARHSQAVIVKP